jgi:hypothetical protein
MIGTMPIGFAWGGYSTVGAAFAVRWQGSPNWTGVRNGVGDATLTWTSGQGVDATQSGVFHATRTAGTNSTTAVQADTTLQILATDLAVPGAAEAAVDFLVLAWMPG